MQMPAESLKEKAAKSVCECVCVRENVCVCVCVCVREREREREEGARVNAEMRKNVFCKNSFAEECRKKLRL